MTMVCHITFKTSKAWRKSIRNSHTPCAACSSRVVATTDEATGLL